MVQGEDKLNGSAQATKSEIDKGFNEKKKTGFDLAASTRKLAATTRP